MLFSLECGGVFSGSSGSFSSPKYPDQYPANARCNYEIRVPTNLKIVLEIHFYDLEKSFDKLRLSQMSSGSYNLVAEFTGIERTPRNYTSAENRFTLLFTSDGSGSRKGFLASYRTILGKQFKTFCKDSCNIVLDCLLSPMYFSKFTILFPVL